MSCPKENMLYITNQSIQLVNIINKIISNIMFRKEAFIFIDNFFTPLNNFNIEQIKNKEDYLKK